MSARPYTTQLSIYDAIAAAPRFDASVGRGGWAVSR
jgi:hypothetical protein